MHPGRQARRKNWEPSSWAIASNAQGQPTFRYRIAGVTVEDTPRPVVEQGRFVGFDRSLKLNGTATGQLYFRGAPAHNK